MHSSWMRTARGSSRPGGGDASVHVGIHPLGVNLETPPRCGLVDSPQVWAWRTPQPDLSTSCPECGPGGPPWRPARHAEIPPARHAGIPSPHLKACWDTTCNVCCNVCPPPPPVDRILDTRF